ncbi:MAG: rod-binding protein [Candidatus Hydrogenedens sp.]
MLYVNPINYVMPNINLVGNEDARKKVAGEEMERLFLYELLKEMRKTIVASKLFPQNSTKEIYYDMLNDALAGEMAKSGQLGIAKQIIQNTGAMEQRANNTVKIKSIDKV